MIRALGFMSKLKYVTDQECIDRYIEAEARRKAWFDEHGWEFTPNVESTRLPLLSYNTVADVNGHEYDKMICAALLAAFGKRTTNSTVKMFADISISVNGTDEILSDVINFVAKLATVTHDLGDLEPDEVAQVIEVLHKGLSKKVPALELGMRTATEGKGYSVDQWCGILVEKATQRMDTTDEFGDWEKDKSKGNQPVSDSARSRSRQALRDCYAWQLVRVVVLRAHSMHLQGPCQAGAKPRGNVVGWMVLRDSPFLCLLLLEVSLR
jgi:hypothetical protein